MGRGIVVYVVEVCLILWLLIKVIWYIMCRFCGMFGDGVVLIFRMVFVIYLGGR